MASIHRNPSTTMTLAGLPLLVALTTLSSPLPTQDTLRLSLDEAREIARSEAPTVRAARARLDVARGAAHAFRTYPYNPRAEVKASELVDPGGRGDYEAILSQEFEWAGQNGLRAAASRSSATAAADDYARSTSLFAADVEIAFHRLIAVNEKVRVRDEAAALASMLHRAVDAQQREGAATLLEANLASIQSAQSEAARQSARADAAAASGLLARLLGLDPTVRIVPEGTTAPPSTLAGIETWLEEASQGRSDLSAAGARIEEAEARSRLASRSVIPNVDLAAVASRSSSNAPSTLGLRISVGLPMWNRNQGAREEEAARVQLRTEEERDLALAVIAEVAAAWEHARAATASLALYDADVLAQARQNRTLLERARSAGQLDLPTTLVLQSQVIEAELAYWDMWLQAHVAGASLAAAAGRGFS